jgi:hypothetical protein
MWHPVRPTVWVMPPAPYAVQGEGWMLHLDKGVFRLLHSTTGWHSLGSFIVSGNRLEVFNDPYCLKTIGTYTWHLEEDRLILSAVRDDCGGKSPFQSGEGLRSKVLAGFPWVGHRLDQTPVDD